jgi:hypothetical protein
MFFEHKSRDVTERTMVDYRRDYANWIEPWLGHRAAESVDETDVQKLVDHMALTLAPKSVADRHMMLHSMFNFGRAKSRRLVEHNPCEETELPARTRSRPRARPSPSSGDSSRRPASGNPDARDLILFLGETGWRFSEAAALDVAYVEDDGVDMWVTVSQVFRLDGSYRQVLAPSRPSPTPAFRRIRLFPESAAMSYAAACLGLAPWRPRVHQLPRSPVEPEHLPARHLAEAASPTPLACGRAPGSRPDTALAAAHARRGAQRRGGAHAGDPAAHRPRVHPDHDQRLRRHDR